MIIRLLAVTCLVLWTVVSPAKAAAGETYIIYDKNWRVEGYWKDKGDIIEKFDKDWRRDGFIKKEGDRQDFFDNSWKREGYIEKDRIDKEKSSGEE